jgi:threonine dehydratase
LERRAIVVVSTDASIAKVAAIRRFGVELIQVGTSFDHAEAHALELAADGTSQYVSAYNDPHVIAGQSTIGFEFDAQLNGPLTVVCPVGGGGLASGLGPMGLDSPRRADHRSGSRCLNSGLGGDSGWQAGTS